MLENALIKQYMPHYNILLKDDKAYPFVRLSREALVVHQVHPWGQGEGIGFFQELFFCHGRSSGASRPAMFPQAICSISASEKSIWSRISK